MKLNIRLAAIAFGLCIGTAFIPTDSYAGASQCGGASWYGPGFQGRKTASGERFNMHGMSAAHRTLPFGTKLRVKNLRNGRSVIVRVNDRGPFVRGRVIDLSKGAATKLGMMKTGTARVRIQRVGGGGIKGGYACS
ncbi:MAG: septal ring lytic transglycosylase RlpA family protein [Rhodobiaceae bacterium]|nr:septal ring lytic transglycosylase RlpA family protein [Rhodobiaceae bacterium]